MVEHSRSFDTAGPTQRDSFEAWIETGAHAENLGEKPQEILKGAILEAEKAKDVELHADGLKCYAERIAGKPVAPLSDKERGCRHEAFAKTKEAFLAQARSDFNLLISRGDPTRAFLTARKIRKNLLHAGYDSDALDMTDSLSGNEVDKMIEDALHDSHIQIAERALCRLHVLADGGKNDAEGKYQRDCYHSEIKRAALSFATFGLHKIQTKQELGLELAHEIRDAKTRTAMQRKYENLESWLGLHSDGVETRVIIQLPDQKPDHFR